MLDVMKKLYGYSLAELLIVVTILSIVIGIAVPALGQQLENQRKVEALNQMLGVLGYTRSTAAFNHRPAVLCAGIEDCIGTTRWSSDLLIFHDSNGNARRDANEPPLRHEKLPEGYSWHWASFRKLDYIVFQSNGTARAANGTLTLCREGQAQYQVIINIAGRIRHQLPAANSQCP